MWPSPLIEHNGPIMHILDHQEFFDVCIISFRRTKLGATEAIFGVCGNAVRRFGQTPLRFADVVKMNNFFFNIIIFLL